MTNADRQSLNERIALKRGWEPAESRYEHYRYGRWKNDWRHESSNGGYVYSHDGPPDFTREWKHAGPLWTALVEKVGFDDTSFAISEQFGVLMRKEIEKPLEDKETVENVLIEAIALTYDAWEEEKE